MFRKRVSLAAFLFLILGWGSIAAGPRGELHDLTHERTGPRGSSGERLCAGCAAQTPVLESGRPPLPGEEGDGVASCTLVNTSADWDAYCIDNSIPDCPFLGSTFFDGHTVVAVAIDTVTARPCDGSPDPLWRLDCVESSSRMLAARVVRQRPGDWCNCSMMHQQLQRLFLASAVPKTSAETCTACEEPHTIGCLTR